ncbi:MAG: ABC transporter permease [Steroidobacteraceae bacterium]|jgi:putative ABC transport system permease protein|nr:ABC transporter permease [Steroidobacteraceae bacterium]
MRLLPLAARSLWNRRVAAALTVFAIAVSVALLVGVQKLRTEARESFASTISGTDLIVGARSGPVNLLLYSVFRIGDPTANISWQSYQLVARHPDVAWTIPISLGDSHRGFRVVGTNGSYFEHYRFGDRRPLAFAAGGPFTDLHDAVVGAEVARALGYAIGDRITIAHGIGEGSFAEHDDQPFTIVGILERTGTPVDRSVHVSLEAITAIHEGWESGMRAPAIGARPGETAPADLTPTAITAFLVGLESRAAVFQMQRALNEYRGEALSAVMPGVALQQLWQVVGLADTALLLVAACVVLAGLIGMVTALLTSLNERRREMAILRSVGARPLHVFLLLEVESALLAAAGVVAGFVIAFGAMALAAPLLEQRFGLFVEVGAPTGYDLAIAAAVVGAGLLAGLLPAWRAYRNSLADGLSIRL